MNSLRTISLAVAIALLLVLIGSAGGLSDAMSNVSVAETADKPTGEVGQTEEGPVQPLSLIHISEPTRPY